MSAYVISAVAPSGYAEHWHGINWAKCYQEVKKLQVRIVKATKEGNHRKVKALQWLLTHSFSGKAIAVRRVTENQGKKTPGVDKAIWSTPIAKYEAIKTLKRRGYKPKPLRRIYIPKSNGNKKRPLDIPSMIDRAQQALYLLALQPISETKSDLHSYGFRPERSTADAIQQCFITLAKKRSPQWILEADIQACFEKISHDWLIEHIPIDKEILRRWLKAGYLEKQRFCPTEEGAAQGSIISPVLANMTLDGLQERLAMTCGKVSYKGGRTDPKVNLVRYCDDFIVTGASKELLENEALPVIKEFLSERGLSLSPEKTRITNIAQGFDFLGQNVRKYNGKFLIKPSKKNIQAVLTKIRSIIKDNKAVRQVNLISLLNPVIKGWANYHQYVAAKQTFSKVDNAIWHALWQWCRRRHTQKGGRWIKHRYFHFIGTRSWVFAAPTDEKRSDGATIMKTLHLAAGVAIQRHIKIKAEANPFDPAWEYYFEDRHGRKMRANLAGYKKLIRLWLDQNRRCCVCRQLLTKTTGWHVHHIIRRVDGGNDASRNLVMVHPNCHMQIHNLGLQVTKPAPEKGL